MKRSSISLLYLRVSKSSIMEKFFMINNDLVTCYTLNVHCKSKNDDHSFKIRFGDRSRARLKLQVELIIDSGQYYDKTDYYHSFKTQLEGRPDV